MNSESLKQTATYISEKIPDQPRVGLILRSGLGILADEMNG
ncbi:hypothetical protein [Bacillus sp. B15-48]|nr:hypothetical protein [Bacillus sp. B15-48]